MKIKFTLYRVILFTSLFICNLASANSQSNPSYQTLEESIQALDVTKNKSLNKLSNLNKGKNKSLYEEYSVFLEFLSYQIDAYCLQVSQLYGDDSISELPCPTQYNQGQKLDHTTYTTTDEKNEALDDELMLALGEFDEMLLIEDEKLAQTSRKNRENENSNSSSNSDSSDSGQNNDSSSENDQQSENEDKSKEKSGNLKKYNKEKQTGKGKGSNSKKYNRKKLDKTDDDIVARQLKEAAENETDPELKEKLWEEYYKYKKNTVK